MIMVLISITESIINILQGFERKHNQDRAMSSYQPFSATHGPGGGFDTGS